MSRPYPNRRRNRKGPGPPNGPRRPRIDGYTSFGLGRFYDAVLPDVRGPERREFFNRVGEGTALLAAATCGAIGLASWGFVGGAIAFVASLALANGLLVSGRFIRR